MKSAEDKNMTYLLSLTLHEGLVKYHAIQPPNTLIKKRVDVLCLDTPVTRRLRIEGDNTQYFSK